MRFLEVLTLIFVILKLCSVISWSWWLVLSPMLLYLLLYVILFVSSAIDSARY
ncbi:MAG: hypothetical protein K6A80_01625 [Saccharofermentans sp.]|nr:hypothetical protein [Saccharofermentans sp.]